MCSCFVKVLSGEVDKKDSDRTREIYSENVWTATLKVSIESSEEHRHYPKLPGWTLLLQFGLQREKNNNISYKSLVLFIWSNIKN